MTVKSTIADIRKLRIALIAAFLLFAAGLAADIFLNSTVFDKSLAVGLQIVIGLSGLSCLLYCFIGFPRLLLKTSTSGACFDRLPQPAIVLDRQGLIYKLDNILTNSLPHARRQAAAAAAYHASQPTTREKLQAAKDSRDSVEARAAEMLEEDEAKKVADRMRRGIHR